MGDLGGGIEIGESPGRFLIILILSSWIRENPVVFVAGFLRIRSSTNLSGFLRIQLRTITIFRGPIIQLCENPLGGFRTAAK